jgi:poly(A) polymerase
MPGKRLERTLELLRGATIDTGYDGRLWLVGGYVRDKILGRDSDSDDVDIVLELDSGMLAQFLYEHGITDHAPVTYPRFGTAMVAIGGVNVELVTARRESYAAGSRKPDHVEPATIAEDAHRRDFTINTLLENLHTRELRDPLGTARSDLSAGIIRTPLPAAETFADDPLRMLRAIRFAARFDFQIADETWSAIRDNARLLFPTVSGERIRDEFSKILMGTAPSDGLTLLESSGLLDVFAPELTVMVGVTQNTFHVFPVWEHTLVVLTNLVAQRPDSPLFLRLAALLHDCGKPATRTVGADDRVHFYGHEDIGADLAGKLMARLKFSHSEIATVTSLVAHHMRIGEYLPDQWTDAAVRRFVRSAGSLLDWLFDLHRADVAGLGPDFQDLSRAVHLRQRIEDLESAQDSISIDSPLTGTEIIKRLGIAPGPEIGRIKAALTDAVIDGTLDPGDKEAAVQIARHLLDLRS